MIDDIFSPGQTYKVSFSCYEVRMSHWIEQPHLIRVSDNQTLFSLNGASWSAFAVKWLDDENLTMHVAKYPGRVALDLSISVRLNQGSATGEFRSFSGSLPQLSNWILNL